MILDFAAAVLSTALVIAALSQCALGGFLPGIALFVAAGLIWQRRFGTK